MERDPLDAEHSVRATGWGGRIRTCECRYQKPVPYHLATPQQVAAMIGAARVAGRLIAARGRLKRGCSGLFAPDYSLIERVEGERLE